MEDEHQNGRRMSKRANPSSSSASLPPQVAPTAVVSTARILVEFLEVAINSIVFLKGVYPSGAFDRSRYINLVVQRAGHPELRDYIHTAVTALQPFIQKVNTFAQALGTCSQEGHLENGNWRQAATALTAFLEEQAVKEGNDSFGRTWIAATVGVPEETPSEMEDLLQSNQQYIL